MSGGRRQFAFFFLPMKRGCKIEKRGTENRMNRANHVVLWLFSGEGEWDSWPHGVVSFVDVDS